MATEFAAPTAGRLAASFTVTPHQATPANDTAAILPQSYHVYGYVQGRRMRVRTRTNEHASQSLALADHARNARQDAKDQDAPNSNFLASRISRGTTGVRLWLLRACADILSQRQIQTGLVANGVSPYCWFWKHGTPFRCP